MSFKTLSVVTSVIAFALFVVLLTIPELLFYLFAVDGNSEAFFFGRRAAMLFLGFAALTWAGRNAPRSEARQAICLALAVAMIAMAVLGVVEFLRGFVGPGIALAILTETVIASLFFTVWWRDRTV